MREKVLDGVGPCVELIDLLDGVQGKDVDRFRVFHLLRQEMLQFGVKLTVGL